MKDLLTSFKTKHKAAFAIVELVIAIGIFGAIFTAVAFLSASTVQFYENNQIRIRAGLQLQETVNGIQINKNFLWSEIIANTDGQPKYLEFSNGDYTIQNGSSTTNGITTSFTIEDVLRDGSGNIVESGGSADIKTKMIDVSVSWVNFLGQLQNSNFTLFYNDWNVTSWTEDEFDEFNDGTTVATQITNVNGGEISLDSTIYADWCAPEQSLTAFNLPGNGEAETVFAIPGQVVMGTGANASGQSFIGTTVTDENPPKVTLDGTFDGYKVNAVYTDGNYAYLSTDTNQKEVVILDISSTPYTEVGYFNAPGSSDALAIYVSGNFGFFTQGEYLRIFDLSSKFGERPQISSHRLFKRGTFMEVNGNYAYILIAGAVEELEIVDISNPFNPVTTGYVNVNAGVAVTAINVDEANNRVFIGANASSSYNEMFIIDVTSKYGNRPIIGSYEAGGLSVRDISIVESDSIALLVGVGGEEYQVVDLSDNSNPTYCGGLQVDDGINGIATAIFTESGNAYSYLVTDDKDNELRIIRGGAGNPNQDVELKDVLFVTAGLGAGDTAVLNRMENIPGYNVEVIDHNSVQSADGADKDLIVISATVSSGNLNTKFRDIAVPVMTWEPYIYDDLEMTGQNGGSDFGTQGGQRINVVGSSHPIANGASGNVNVFTGGRQVTWGVSTGGAEVIAHVDGNPGRDAIFVYNTGDTMDGGFTAPAKRVAFFIENDNPTALTNDGWNLFENAVTWAGGIFEAVGSGTCSKSALFVAGSDSLSANDELVKNRIEQITGYSVTVIDDDDVVTSDADSADIVIISSTVNSGSVNTKFKDEPIPVIVWEPLLFDDFNLTSGGNNSSYGTENNVLDFNIVDNTHPIADGFDNGVIQVYDSLNQMSWGKPAQSASIIAQLNSDSSKKSLFAYGQGDIMLGQNAPDKRVAFFFRDTTQDNLTNDGWQLFENALRWAGGECPPVSGGGAETGFDAAGSYVSNVFDTGSVQTNYFYMQMVGTYPEGTNIRLQIRSTNDPLTITESPFLGPDGTTGTYYEGSDLILTPNILDGNRYIQYRLLFITDDPSLTPQFDSVTIYYQTNL